jgi:hypothetical protein
LPRNARGQEETDLYPLSQLVYHSDIIIHNNAMSRPPEPRSNRAVVHLAAGSGAL